MFEREHFHYVFIIMGVHNAPSIHFVEGNKKNM